jgi:hypothetical protein
VLQIKITRSYQISGRDVWSSAWHNLAITMKGSLEEKILLLLCLQIRTSGFIVIPGNSLAHVTYKFVV